MPSPPIKDSSPVPKMNSPRSPFPDGSKKSMWPEKVKNYLRRGGTKKNPNLTEEKLEEFNRINEILHEHRSFSSKGKSPCPRGLTDSSLVLSRHKLSGSSTPGRDSDTASNASSSISSFIIKMQEELRSCFSSLGAQEKAEQAKDILPPGRRRPQHKQIFEQTTLTTLAKEMGLEGKDTNVNTTICKDFLLLKKKPLRERDSNTPSPSQVAPKPLQPSPKTSPTQPQPNKETPSPPQPTNLTPPPPPAELTVYTSPPACSPPSLPPVPVPQYAQEAILSVSLPPRTQTSPQQLQPPPPPEPEPKPPSPPQVEQVIPPSPPQVEQVIPPSPTPQTSSQALVPQTEQNPQGSPTNKTKDEGICIITQEKVYVWADKYRPAALKDFICNRDKASELRTMVKSVDCGHFIFEGPRGVGKRTMILALLREAFGPERIQTREEVKQFVLQGEAEGSFKVAVKMSLQHVEVSLSEVKGYEKHVIVELIQETITKQSKKALQCNKENHPVIILYDADKLSTDALLYLKWQLERHKGCTKIFFCCTNALKLQPIMSLCNVIKLLPPSNEEIIDVLEFVAEQEGIELPHKLAERIANNSKNNLRQAVRSFEATWDTNSTLKEDQVILTGWEDDIVNIAKSIVAEQSPRQLFNVRGKLQNLIEHNVCPEFIFEGLMEELKKCSIEDFHPQIDSLYKKYKNIAPHRHPEKKNLHQFLTIEEFIAKFMSCYKTSIKNRGK